MTKPRLASATLSALTALLLLAGCSAPAPVPTPTRTPVAESTPTPTPTPTPHLATITLNAENAVATDENGRTLATLDYYARGVDLAAQLTELFEFAPTIEVVDPIPSDVRFSGTRYNWEGFELKWYLGYENDPESGISRYPDSARNVIIVTVPSVRGVTIVAADGVKVGDGMGDLSARYPGQTVTFESDGRLIEIAAVSCVEHPDIQDNGPDGGIPRNCISVQADPAEGPVTVLNAPSKRNYGI